MPNRETITHTKAAVLHAADITTSGGSHYVDVTGADAATITVAAGNTGAGGDNGITVKLQHADEAPGSAASYTDVPDEQQRGGPAEITGTNQVHRIAYVGNKRYVRAVWEVTGTIDGPATVVAELGLLEQGGYPATDAPTTGAVA